MGLQGLEDWVDRCQYSRWESARKRRDLPGRGITVVRSLWQVMQGWVPLFEGMAAGY